MAQATPLAAVFGCAGTALSDDERAFFRETNPLGLILFARNCETPDQIRALITDFCDTVGRGDAPALIDQEGGRVARLKPPHWRAAPPLGTFGKLAARSPKKAEEAARLNGRLIAAELHDLGITVDCAPVLDVPQPGAHDVIGDRAAGPSADLAILVGRATAEGLMAGGVLPVIKHIPGHGRANADSHKSLPVVETPAEDLAVEDFAPFRALRSMPWGMTAHVLYRALDEHHPATTSHAIIDSVIRDFIGFDGVLTTDDLSMEALDGTPKERAEAALHAGCDIVLHCNGKMPEMQQVAEGCQPLSAHARERVARGENLRHAPEPFDRDAAQARLDELLAPKRR